MRISNLVAGACALALLSGCSRTDVVGGGVAATTASGETVVACGPQKGHAYYPAAGMVREGKDGWTDDQITGGSTILTQNSNGEFDIQSKDGLGELSARRDGAQVTVLRKSLNEIAVLVAYPDGAQAAEIYSFVHEVNGKAKMLQLSSKGLSAGMAIPKAGVYVASCSIFNLS